MFGAPPKPRFHGAAWILSAAISLLPAVVLAQTLEPPRLLGPGETVPPPPTPSTPAAFPLSFNDPVFSNVTNSGPLTLSGGATRSNLSITSTGGIASVCCGSYTLNTVRISSREAIRAGGGDITLNWVWAEARGQSGDHADVVQCYGPGSSGLVTVNNTTFRAYNNDATAGYFSADNWRGTHRFNNVLFWGGPFGLRLNVDGGAGVYMKDVYFVQGSFGASAFLIDIPILQWENVRWATIVNGQLVPGAAIARPR